MLQRVSCITDSDPNCFMLGLKKPAESPHYAEIKNLKQTEIFIPLTNLFASLLMVVICIKHRLKSDQIVALKGRDASNYSLVNHS